MGQKDLRSPLPCPVLDLLPFFHYGGIPRLPLTLPQLRPEGSRMAPRTLLSPHLPPKTSLEVCGYPV